MTLLLMPLTVAATPAVDSRRVALIRGINVGKAKRLAMADLRAMMGKLGYRDCRTLLNSGNVVFTSDRDTPEESAIRIEGAIAQRCGFEAPVTALGAAEYSTVIAENTLTEIAENPSRLLVAFLMDGRDRKLLEPLMGKDWSPESLALGTHAAYLWIPDGVISSRLHEAVTRALGKAVTARNWRTVLKIHAALEAIAAEG